MKSKCSVRVPRWWLPIVAVAFLLTGCGSARYRTDYSGFNNAYADSSNRQMLMNLARLDQHDPAYFLDFGQISVQYQLSSTANVQGADGVPQSTFHIPFVTGTATVGAGATTTPQFTFIPVTNDKVSQQLLLPLPPQDFYTLFQQGLPVDQLLRLMAERFEILMPGGGSTMMTYSNTPGRCDKLSYVVFLKICAIARELQVAGVLKLRATDEDELVTDDWTYTRDPNEGKRGGKNGDDDPPGDKSGGDAAAESKEPVEPTASDVMTAHDKGFFYKKNSKDSTWSLYKREEVASFYLEGDTTDVFRKIENDRILGQGTTLEAMRTILSSPKGFSIQGDLLAKQGSGGSRLILRSFLGALTAAAEEQTYFSSVIDSKLRPLIAPRELRPILRLKWDHATEPLQSPLLSIDYHSQTYTVTDPVSTDNEDMTSVSWNRDVFRLLTQLGGQASVDTSKFPLPTSLQVLQSP